MIGEHLLPRLQDFLGMELDIDEKVLSGVQDPRFGDEATLPKCLFVVVQKLNHVIKDFQWERWVQHRGSSCRSRAKRPGLTL